jgi:hypothetical protein
MKPPPAQSPARSEFSPRSLLQFSAAWLVGMSMMRVAVRAVCTRHPTTIDCPYYWPLSVFLPRLPDPLAYLWAVLLAAAAWMAWRRLPSRGTPLVLVAGLATLLVLGTTLLHGWDAGFALPIAGARERGVWVAISERAQGYYQEARDIVDVGNFLATYTAHQPGLSLHSRTHPPGAILLFYPLHRLGFGPHAIGVLIAALSVMGTMLATGWLSVRLVSPSAAGTATIILGLMAPVHIYFAASIDGVVATFVTLAVAAFAAGTGGALAVCVAASLTSLLLSFGSLFVVPVFALFEWWQDKRVTRTAFVVGGVAAGLAVLWAITGFDWIESFGLAGRDQNPWGFFLIEDPLNYAITRLEGICEVIVFLGPPLLYVLAWMIRSPEEENRTSRRLMTAALTSFGLMLVSGAYRTGETARACVFLYPLLVSGMAPTLARLSGRETGWLAGLVFAQTLLMQLFGFWVW